MLIDPQGNIFGVSCIILIKRVGIDYINVVVHDKKIAPQIAGLKVENNGVEPMTSCMPCKRSSQLS